MNMDQYIGRLLDNRYEILEIIGTGGMAVVYKARCHRLNRLVAIKILKDEYARDEEFRRRFQAEGEAVAMLSHPNIVQVYDVSSSDNANYIVMELIEGISLKQYMEKKGVLNWKETLHFAMQIAKGLDHAHGRGIVHRDIKPHNVMVLKNGSVKVMDFGIARVMNKSNTLTKEALGSVHYISPEQAKGGYTDNRSDIYSLSVVMYEMMTGRPPYDGESAVAVAIQHINGGAAMPSTLNPNIPGGLEQIIMKGMALDVKDRYASAAEMLKDMDEFRKNPSMLFNFDLSKPVNTDATQPINLRAVSGAPKTTAEKVARRADAAGSRTGESGRIRNTGTTAQRTARTDTDNTGRTRKKTRRQIEEERKRGRMTTIAIVSCSVVAVIAIIIFLIALVNGQFFKSDLIMVPDLKGKVYDSSLHYDDFIVEVDASAYNDSYAKGQIIDQNPENGTEVVKGTTIKVTVSLGPEPQVKYMEDLVGMDQETAMAFLTGQGVNPLPQTQYSEIYPEGTVIKTDPELDTELVDGQTVKVYISAGPLIETAVMPNVVGYNLATAMELLTQKGFKEVEPQPVESDAAKDVVVDQSVAKDTELDVTTKIILKVSKGPKETEATSQPTESGEATSGTTEPQERTLPVTITLPIREEAYVVTLYSNGQIVKEATQIMPGTESISFQLTGTGIQTYDLYINDVFYNSYEVNFNEDD